MYIEHNLLWSFIILPVLGDIGDENKENDTDKPLDSIALSKFLEKAVRVSSFSEFECSTIIFSVLFVIVLAVCLKFDIFISWYSATIGTGMKYLWAELRSDWKLKLNEVDDVFSERYILSWFSGCKIGWEDGPLPYGKVRGNWNLVRKLS